MKDFNHEGFGYIKYDPYRANMKNKRKWWCVVQVDKEISRYYRWWIKKEYGLMIHQPAWDCHISVIRGERPKGSLIELWKKYDGIKVNFRYSINVYPNNYGKFFTVEVESNDLLHMRKELQLPTDYGLHITIGKTYDMLDNISLNRLYGNI